MSVKQLIKMENYLPSKRFVKISLLTCLPIVLVLTILMEIALIVVLTAPKDEFIIIRKTLAYVVGVSEAIIILVQIFGIVVVSLEHYHGSIALTVLEGVILFYMTYIAIIGWNTFIIIKLSSHIITFGLCIVYVRQIKGDSTNPHYNY